MTGTEADALFELDGVTVETGGRQVLDRVDLVIPTGCLTVICGPSGAGKTSLLRLLNRLDVPTRGSVSLRAADLTDLDGSELRRDVAMVFQQPPLFPGTAADNLRVADPDLSPSDVEIALTAAGLSEAFADQGAETLSGGEAQRLCFARALLSSPSVLLADEPTSALDAGPKRALEALARRLVDDGLSVVWVTHEADQIHRIADHVVVLGDGRVVAEGSLEAMTRDPSPAVRATLEGDS